MFAANLRTPNGLSQFMRLCRDSSTDSLIVCNYFEKPSAAIPLRPRFFSFVLLYMFFIVYFILIAILFFVALFLFFFSQMFLGLESDPPLVVVGILLFGNWLTNSRPQSWFPRRLLRESVCYKEGVCRFQKED